MILACPVCAGATTALGRPVAMPVLMNRLYPTREVARAAPTGTMALQACRACGFVWNAAFDPALMVYDAAYENDQCHSPAFVEHVEGRARAIVAALQPDEDLHLLEIGCGQGRFLETMAAVAGDRLASATGYDPSWRGASEAGPAGSRIVARYFDRETAAMVRAPPNAVMLRHTIEHIPEPARFLEGLRAALGETAAALVFVETPCVDWILRHGAVQDFFYEHCSLFTATSLGAALERAGFLGARVDHVFGGQYLWAEAAIGRNRPATNASVAPATRFDLDTARPSFVARWRGLIDLARVTGPVAIWGAGAKGVAFALLTDPDGTLIDHAVDVNPAKQGRHLALSGLPVVSPAASVARRPATIIVMNPNYLAEIRASLGELGADPEFLVLDAG